MDIDAFLADVILFVHAGYVAFTVGGEIAILLGAALRWRWIRNLPFRIAHTTAVVLVAVEALIGVSCPLTVWEYRLRLLADERVGDQIPFIARAVRSIIFHDFPAWVFVLVYVGFAIAVVATLVLVPPGRQRRSGRHLEVPRGSVNPERRRE